MHIEQNLKELLTKSYVVTSGFRNIRPGAYTTGNSPYVKITQRMTLLHSQILLQNRLGFLFIAGLLGSGGQLTMQGDYFQ